MSGQKLFPVGSSDLQSDGIYFHDQRDLFDCSNFIDAGWLSSSGNSIEEDSYTR